MPDGPWLDIQVEPDGARHVLVVDDDEAIRESLRSLFEHVGYTVHEASDGMIAMDILLISTYPLVVILDLMMPRLSGYTILQMLASDPAWARRHAFVVLTAANEPEGATELRTLLTSLSITLLQKPFDVDSLLAATAEAASRLPTEPS